MVWAPSSLALILAALASVLGEARPNTACSSDAFLAAKSSILLQKPCPSTTKKQKFRELEDIVAKNWKN